MSFIFTARAIGIVRSPHKETREIPKGLGSRFLRGAPLLLQHVKEFVDQLAVPQAGAGLIFHGVQ